MAATNSPPPSPVSPRSSPSLIGYLRDDRVLQIIGQIVFALILIAALYGLTTSILNALVERNLTPNLVFLQNRAGFDISEKPEWYSANSTYWDAYTVGITNTLRVVVLGLVLSTLLGIFVGVALLSRNWLVRTIFTVYVELLRNTPLLVQLFAWYFVVMLSLPTFQQSLSFPQEGITVIPLRFLLYALGALLIWSTIRRLPSHYYDRRRVYVRGYAAVVIVIELVARLGIINGGGFLLIRMSDVVQASPGAMAALVMLGGLTALFGAAVMLTQSAVKTALAWSTVAQMGFMLLQCGMGLWALALLHIVAHSLYKAHAFLASGGAVRAVAEVHRPGPVAVPGIGAVARAFVLALVLYAVVATGFSLIAEPKSTQALALGAILIFGVAYLVAQGLADTAPWALTQRTAVASLVAAVTYFGFQVIAAALWGPYLPFPPVPGPLEWALIVLALMSFGLVAIAQALFPHWAHHPAAAGLRVHLANGLYLNAVLDRMIGGFKATKPL